MPRRNPFDRKGRRNPLNREARPDKPRRPPAYLADAPTNGPRIAGRSPEEFKKEHGLSTPPAQARLVDRRATPLRFASGCEWYRLPRVVSWQCHRCGKTAEAPFDCGRFRAEPTPEGTPKGTGAAQKRLRKWLVDIMRKSPKVKTHSKAALKDAAGGALNEHIGDRLFARAWAGAVEDVEPSIAKVWRKAGRPSQQNRHARIDTPK